MCIDDTSDPEIRVCTVVGMADDNYSLELYEKYELHF